MAANDIDFFSSGDSFSTPSTLGSPLFLHHSDHPGLLLVSKRLNGDDYNSWHRAMKISLSARISQVLLLAKSKNPMRPQILKNMPFGSAATTWCFNGS